MDASAEYGSLHNPVPDRQTVGCSLAGTCSEWSSCRPGLTANAASPGYSGSPNPESSTDGVRAMRYEILCQSALAPDTGTFLTFGLGSYPGRGRGLIRAAVLGLNTIVATMVTRHSIGGHFEETMGWDMACATRYLYIP